MKALPLFLFFVRFFLAGDLYKLVFLIARVRNVGGVTDKNDTFSLICKLTENIHDFFLRFSVKIAGRLVSEYDVGIVGKRACDRNSLIQRTAFLKMYI